MIKRLILATLILLPMADVMNSQQADTDLLFESPDQLHPTAEGYRRMAVAIRPAVEQALRKRDSSRRDPSR